MEINLRTFAVVVLFVPACVSVFVLSSSSSVRSKKSMLLEIGIGGVLNAFLRSSSGGRCDKRASIITLIAVPEECEGKTISENAGSVVGRHLSISVIVSFPASNRNAKIRKRSEEERIPLFPKIVPELITEN